MFRKMPISICALLSVLGFVVVFPIFAKTPRNIGVSVDLRTAPQNEKKWKLCAIRMWPRYSLMMWPGRVQRMWPTLAIQLLKKGETQRVEGFCSRRRGHILNATLAKMWPLYTYAVKLKAGPMFALLKVKKKCFWFCFWKSCSPCRKEKIVQK